jgi:hypothetical protein
LNILSLLEVVVVVAAQLLTQRVAVAVEPVDIERQIILLRI